MVKQKKLFKFIEFLLGEFVKTVIDVVLKSFSSGFGSGDVGRVESPSTRRGLASRRGGAARGGAHALLPFSFYSIHTEKYFPYSVNKGNIIFCFWWYFYDREMRSMVLLPCTYIVRCVLMKDSITIHKFIRSGLVLKTIISTTSI